LALGAGLLAIAPASPAADPPGHFQVGVHSLDHLLQGQDHLVAEVGSWLGPSGPAALPPKTEEIFENLAKGAENIIKAAEAPHIQTGQAGMAVKVVKLPLLSVGQDLIGFGNALELLFRQPIPGVLIRMVPQGQPAVRALDLLQGGAPRNPQDFIIIIHLKNPLL
jgi:hypothetical protein